jgi:hypothetical protein
VACECGPDVDSSAGIFPPGASWPKETVQIRPRADRSPPFGSTRYHLLPSVCGDLLSKLGRMDEAHKEFERAAAMAQNVRERELLLARAKTCAKACAGEPLLASIDRI